MIGTSARIREQAGTIVNTRPGDSGVILTGYAFSIFIRLVFVQIGEVYPFYHPAVFHVRTRHDFIDNVYMNIDGSH